MTGRIKSPGRVADAHGVAARNPLPEGGDLAGIVEGAGHGHAGLCAIANQVPAFEQVKRRAGGGGGDHTCERWSHSQGKQEWHQTAKGFAGLQG